jgi:two-component system sensor histidine kinase BaeS
MLTIRSKLFITIFLSLLLTIASLAVMEHLSVKHGFIHYLSEKEKYTLNQLKQPLIDQYAQTDSWQPLLAQPDVWRITLHSALKQSFSAITHTPDTSLNARADKYIEHIINRIFLLDANKNLLLGHLSSEPPSDVLPLIYQGKTIAYLGMLHRQGLTEKVEQEFANQLLHSLGWIVLITLLIAASLALWLARHFGQPIEALRHASQQLAEGRYNVRINASGLDELGLLSRDFNILAERLEQNESARKQWVADIAHELRTPLTILRGEVEALQDGINEPSASSFASLHQEVSQLQRLVDDLYQLAMSDSGALTYIMQPIDMIALLNDSVASHASQFKAKSLQLDTRFVSASPVFISGDAQRLQQLMHNLLENTLRYTDAPGTLLIHTQIEDGQLEIIFADSAPAVPAESLPKLFDRLYRVDGSRNRATGGAGLGLSISYNIVIAHHGTIKATASALGGLAIHIHFPIVQG